MAVWHLDVIARMTKGEGRCFPYGSPKRVVVVAVHMFDPKPSPGEKWQLILAFEEKFVKLVGSRSMTLWAHWMKTEQNVEAC